MIRPVLRAGHPKLMEESQPVREFGTSALHALIEDMVDTMAALDGAGLAAPQIGIGLRVVIFGFAANQRYPEAEPVPFTVLVNPEIEPLDEEQTLGWEGCLSLPGLRGEVPRYQRIRYTGRDPEGGSIDRSVSGFHARVVQHECDHLDGVLYPMRMRDLARFGFGEEINARLASERRERRQ